MKTNSAFPICPRFWMLWLILAGLVSYSELFQIPSANAQESVQRYAFLVAVEKYPESALEFAYEDISQLGEALKGFGFVGDSNVRFFHDNQSNFSPTYPTKTAILDALEAFVKEIPENAILIVAFSGHGASRKAFGPNRVPTSFLIPIDATTDPESWISMEDVYQRTADGKQDSTIMILDACRNHTAASNSNGDFGVPDLVWKAKGLAKPKAGPFGDDTLSDKDTAFVLPSRGPDRTATISSCGSGELSWESTKFKHGVFMHYLLEGIQGYAEGYQGGNRPRNYDNETTLDEVFKYATDRTATEQKNPSTGFSFQRPRATFSQLTAAEVNFGKAVGIDFRDGQGNGKDLRFDQRFKNEAIRRGLNLRHGKFQKCDLSGLDLSKLDLTGADFTGATLDGTIFTSSEMTKVCLDGADCSNAIFTQANLRGVSALKTTFDSATFSGLSRFSRGMTFHGATFIGAKNWPPR